jgi:hypothetical protein
MPAFRKRSPFRESSRTRIWATLWMCRRLRRSSSMVKAWSSAERGGVGCHGEGSPGGQGASVGSTQVLTGRMRWPSFRLLCRPAAQHVGKRPGGARAGAGATPLASRDPQTNGTRLHARAGHLSAEASSQAHYEAVESVCTGARCVLGLIEFRIVSLR